MRIGAAALAATILATQAGACDYLHAQYVLKGDPSVTAGFIRQIRKSPTMEGDLFFYIRVGNIKRTFWFFPDRGNGDVTMVSTFDPHRKDWTAPDSDSSEGRPYPDEHFSAFDDKLDYIGEMPTSEDRAAKLLYLPHFADDARYRFAAERVDVAHGFFIRTRCGLTAK